LDKLLKDKVCIITGVGKGFGKDLAISFIDQGAKLALITRNEDDVATLKNFLNVSGHKENFFILCGDVTDGEIVQSLVDIALDKFGRVDVLLNNAGMRHRKPFLSIDKSDFHQVMNNNFFSMVDLCQRVIPQMIKQRSGKIINLSSIAGVLGLPELSAYVCSKSAVNGLTKTLAVEFAGNNIQINAIAAGFSKTSYFQKFQKNDELYNFTIDRIPMRRWGESKEIVNVCLFLASHMSDYVTGEILNVDGGWSAW